ncbi:DUF4177 domain-containing protein [Alkalihalobacterium elongatum]|uniref:DUF4177 domain-containing protein n=1 Tax=Alkalihalobacterium elongatum TaxID=2675466 RepID=UPI001C1F7194|nr:DUF4177 domain-containing protein [Alkalihalobacterium elongatum]
MKQYEYKIEDIRIQVKNVFTSDQNTLNELKVQKLNALGKEGWELAGVSGTTFYFKREIKR